jgi:hypothetical protein
MLNFSKAKDKIMQITVTFGTGDDTVKMTDQAESVPVYLDILKELGWQIDQITEITTKINPAIPPQRLK